MQTKNGHKTSQPKTAPKANQIKRSQNPKTVPNATEAGGQAAWKKTRRGCRNSLLIREGKLEMHISTAFLNADLCEDEEFGDKDREKYHIEQPHTAT